MLQTHARIYHTKRIALSTIAIEFHLCTDSIFDFGSAMISIILSHRFHFFPFVLEILDHFGRNVTAPFIVDH